MVRLEDDKADIHSENMVPQPPPPLCQGGAPYVSLVGSGRVDTFLLWC